MLIEFLPSFFIFSQPVPVPSLSQLYCPPSPRGSPRTWWRGEIVIENIFKRSDGQTASRLIFHFACSIAFIATMAISGETLQERSKGKDVRTSNIVAAKVRVVFALELAGILGILRYRCRCRPTRAMPPALKISARDRIGCDRLAERGGPRPPCPATHYHGPSLSYKFLSSLMAFHLISFLNTHPLCFVLPSPTTTMQCRPWPTPSAPPWDPAGWTS